MKEAIVIDKVKTPVATPVEVPMDKPGGFTVVLLNDPVTPFEVVIEAIMYGASLSEAEAIKRMMKAHRNGWSPVAAYASKDIADTVANKIQIHARGNTRFDKYRVLSNHKGPWPLTAEVMESGG